MGKRFLGRMGERFLCVILVILLGAGNSVGGYLCLRALVVERTGVLVEGAGAGDLGFGDLGFGGGAAHCFWWRLLLDLVGG